MMSQLIPEGVIAWVCVAVQFCCEVELTTQIAFALESCSVQGEFKDSCKFNPTRWEKDFKTFILNMKDLNHIKFMEAGEAELMDPDEGLELDQCQLTLGF